MTKRDIARALPFWQRVLRLGDWDITVRTVPSRDLIYLDGDPCDGLTHWNTENMEADIKLRRGVGEEVLVHELLHVALDGEGGQKEYNALYERGINRIAGGLMALAYPTIP